MPKKPRSAIGKLTAALAGHEHIAGTSAYFAARAFRNANLRVGSDARRKYAMQAVKAFNVRVKTDSRGELELWNISNTECLFSFSQHRYGSRCD